MYDANHNLTLTKDEARALIAWHLKRVEEISTTVEGEEPQPLVTAIKAPARRGRRPAAPKA